MLITISRTFKVGCRSSKYCPGHPRNLSLGNSEIFVGIPEIYFCAIERTNVDNQQGHQLNENKDNHVQGKQGQSSLRILAVQQWRDIFNELKLISSSGCTQLATWHVSCVSPIFSKVFIVPETETFRNIYKAFLYSLSFSVFIAIPLFFSVSVESCIFSSKIRWFRGLPGHDSCEGAM